MKRLNTMVLGLVLAMSIFSQNTAISTSGEKNTNSASNSASAKAYVPNQDNTIALKKKYHTYIVANQNDVAKIYRKEGVVKKNCFFVISKQEYRLYVYEVADKDTLLNASFPICYGREKGPKTKTGDYSTPECSMAKPARISQIQNASAWTHDFKDGRGGILAFGHWFMRLDLSQSDCHQGCRSNRSIGIHGSTNNRCSVPGRDSAGCIRLRDEDLNTLYSLYAQEGTRVVIKSGKQGKLPFEVRAEKKCKDYVAPTQGYKEY